MIIYFSSLVNDVPVTSAFKTEPGDVVLDVKGLRDNTVISVDGESTSPSQWVCRG